MAIRLIRAIRLRFLIHSELLDVIQTVVYHCINNSCSATAYSDSRWRLTAIEKLSD